MTLDSLTSFVKKLFAKVPRNKYTYGLAAVLIIALGWFAFGGGGSAKEETRVVQPGPFLKEVSVSGKVKPSEEVQMAFEETGRVEKIYVTVGQQVAQGVLLASVSSGTLGSQLAAAEAEATLKRIEAKNESINLDEVKKQQDTLVASARRTLLSEGLEAAPQSTTYTVTAPTITGVYRGTDEGTYKVRFLKDEVNSTQYEINVFGLEEAVEVKVSKTSATPLGTKGLFISFPDELELYDNTTWYIDIPNEKSAAYTANFNDYQEALRARDVAVAEAEAEISQQSEGLTIAGAELRAAEAEVMRIKTELAQRSLRAPFDGVVTAIDAKLGSAVSVNDTAVSMISADSLEIESFVPEINISYLQVGDAAVVTLDAYGESVPFEARVVAIDPAETIRDGVSTYRVRLQFNADDERIKSGMTANIVITTDERDGVIAVPQGIVEEKNGKYFVPVKKGDKTELREVTTGSVSSLGEIEILSGLVGGETIVLNASDL